MSASIRPVRGWLVGLVLMSAFCLLPTTSDAGPYTLKQCLGSGFEGFSGDYRKINTLDRIEVVSGCRPGNPAKVGLYQDRSGRPVQGSGGGQFLWSPDSSVRITGVTFNARLKDVDGMKAQLLGPRSAGGTTMLDEGQPHDGQVRTMRWTGKDLAPALVIARLWCVRTSGCENRPNTPRAYLEIYDMEIQGRDFLPPSLEASGEIWNRSQLGGWLRGPAGYRIGAADRGSGVSGGALEVNGLTVNLPAVTCPGDRGPHVTSLTPCPGTVERTGSFDSSNAPFREGTNSFRFCVTDFAIPREAANRTCTQRRTVMVDNTSPLPPSGLEVIGGSAWRVENGFELSWQIPPGQTSAIASAEYSVIDPGNGLRVGGGVAEGHGIQSLGPVEVPSAGEYRVEVRLRDEAGNLGGPASVVARFDDSPPGDVVPEEPFGWISKNELPLSQPIERATAGGPSGISGYAIAVTADGPAHPCAGEVCAHSELALAGGPDSRVATIASLPEGNHWVSAVAVSGARLSSRQPGSALLRVDRTDPETTLSGVPPDWVNHPVTLTAEASDELSGMVAEPGRDDGTPKVVIAPEGQAPYESPGRKASFTIIAEGASTVRYWAMDLAGNVNDGRLTPGGERRRPPGSATVRIDLTPPALHFSATPDPSVPEMVSAFTSDLLSGVESGRIEIRRISDGGIFTPLKTELSGEELRAIIPSDDLPPGFYELRAVATDRAGNTSTSIAREDGSAMVLSLPLKRPVQLSLQHPGRRTQQGSVTSGYRKPVLLTGLITHPGGARIPGASLVLEQRFNAGSRIRIVRSRITSDVTGRFAARLRPGPSRVVRVLYDGTALNGRAISRRPVASFKDRTSLGLTPEVLRNGGRVLMKGAVSGDGAIQPASGKLVAIEFFDPERALWRPVEVLRADRRGRFRFSYRFRTITSAQRILFRAVSLAEAGWPYLPSTSKPRSVTIYPSSPR